MRFHRAGVEAGFRSNGEPGYRDYGAGYYAAYLLDPDGNNVEALYRDVGNIGHGRARRCAETARPTPALGLRRREVRGGHAPSARALLDERTEVPR